MAAEISNLSTSHAELLRAWPSNPSQHTVTLIQSLSGWSTWQYIVAFLLAVVFYDQGTQQCPSYKFHLANVI